MLVSALHLEQKQVHPSNCSVLYEEYRQFTSRQSSSDVEDFSAPVFLASFERLLARGLLVMEDRGTSAVACGLVLPGLVDRQFLAVRRGVAIEEIEGCITGNEVTMPQWVKTWAMTERTE